MRYALALTYDGSNYHGWQNQPSSSSIQQALEHALSKVADHKVTAICAGRTDSGVHALSQIVHFDTTAVRDIRGWLLGVNTNLPRDVRVQWIQETSEDFHARFSAVSRRYRYIIYNNFIASALLHNQTTWYPQLLDEKIMLQAAQCLIGEHDFTSYRAMACQAHSPVRTIYELNISRQNKFIFIDIKGNGFLHHMIRNIAGVLMSIGSGKRDPIWAQEVLEARDRRAGDVTAPPSGLYFMEVEYPEKFNLPKSAQDILILG